MTKARDLADLIAAGNPLADGAISVAEISDLTASAAEINKLDGLVASAAELDNVVGTTSALQTQLDNISVTSGSLTKSFTSGETASITLAQAISPAPVVSVTKEVPQVGIVSKGAWDVNASASNYDLHNTAYATTLTAGSVTTLGDISDSTYSNQTFSVANEGNLPADVNFKTDGTKMYVFDRNSGVHQYSLSTAWDVSTASYDSVSFTGYTSYLSASGNEYAFTISTDGYHLYIVDAGNANVLQFTMSTAWNISTASYVRSKATSFITVSIFFKPDGTKFYGISQSNNQLFQFDLTTAWDISTASYTGGNDINYSSLSTGGQYGLLSDTGTKVYILTTGTTGIYQYSLSTAWDLSTATYDSSTFDHSTTSADRYCFGMFLRDNGDYYLPSNNNDTIHKLSFGIATNALVLGTGSFASTDVGKRIQGNGGDVTLTSTAGAYSTTGGSAFTDSSTIASGSWTMRGLKSAGDADGIGLAGVATESFAFGTYTKSHNVTSPADTPINLAANSNGSKWFVFNQNGTEIFEFLASTPGDITTLSYTMSHNVSTAWVTSSPSALTAAGDGSRFYMTGSTGGYVYVATTGNGSVNGIGSWVGYQIIPNTDTSSSIQWKPDGSKIYIKGVSAVSNPSPAGMTYSGTGCYIYAYDVPTAWDVNSINTSATSTFYPRENQYSPFVLTDNGTHVVIGNYNDSTYYVYKLNTAWDITSVDYSTEIIHDNSTENTDNSSSEGAIGMTYVNDKIYTISYNIKKITEWPWAATSSYSQPTSQYHIGVTNSGGQIDSSTWNDINSMTADQAAGDGTVHYAVSTDDRTTWSVAKASDGVRPIVRDNAGTWQYNSDLGSFASNDLSIANYANDSFTFSNVGGNYTVGCFWSTDGTRLFIVKSQYVAEIRLSTAYDVSTGTYYDIHDVGSEDTVPFDVWLNSNGSRMYVSGGVSDTIYQYNNPAYFSVSGVNYTGNSINVQAQDTENRGIWFGPEDASLRPTKMFMVGGATNTVYEYGMTTAGNLSTASYSNNSFSVSSQQTDCSGLSFSADGTVMFISGRNPEGVHQYSLSTAWDITTASYSNVFYDTTSFVTTPYGCAISSNGEHLLIADESSGYVYNVSVGGYAYGTSTTWTNATTNDEFYALQEALGATSVNRMDKTQLDAVADGSHFTLGDTLDLAIALRQDTASASTPKSDGVSINYDAQALNQGAVLGTDYDYDFPDSTTVRVTSNAAQNLKVRVV